jgi:hypothetical protein
LLPPPTAAEHGGIKQPQCFRIYLVFGERSVSILHLVRYACWRRELFRNTQFLFKCMITQQDIDRLRTRAAHYRREAARAKSRDRLIYCRALAAHLAREASELERVVRKGALSEPELTHIGYKSPEAQDFS